MFFQKLKYKIRTFNSKFTALHINWWNIFGRLILLLIIIGLSANIYSTFQKVYTTAERFQVEQEKLELIKKENDELKDQVKEYASIEAAKEVGAATLNYGTFIQSVIDFLIIALCIFLLIRLLAKLMPKKEGVPAPKPRLCPYCRQAIDKDATRCPHCTSKLDSPQQE